VLQEMDAQHALHPHRQPAPALPFGIKRLDHRRQLRPGNNPVHFVEKLFPPGRLAVFLEYFFSKGLLAHAMTLWQSVGEQVYYERFAE